MGGDVFLLPLYVFFVWAGNGLPFYLFIEVFKLQQYIKHVIFNVGLPSLSFDAVLAYYLVGSPAEVSFHKCKAGPSFKQSELSIHASYIRL
jgi:hypothetical protein